MSQFGEFLSELRREKAPLGKFCRAHKINPTDWGMLERGAKTPPDDEETIRRYAEALGLVEGGERWEKFQALAQEEAGREPKRLSEEELDAKMPVFFRTHYDKDDMAGDDCPELYKELKDKLREIF